MRHIAFKGETAILQKAVFEVKYRHGLRYLDVCGSTLNAIQKEQDEWILPNDANPQVGSLLSLVNGCVANFSGVKLDLSLEKPAGEGPLSADDFDRYLAQIDSVPSLIIDRLGVTEFSRLGFRSLYLFSMDDMEHSETWLRELGVYSFSDALIASFGGQVEATSALILIGGAAAKYRIALSGVERQAQIDFGQAVLNVQPRMLPAGQRDHIRKQMEVKRRMRQNPEFAVQLDIDCSLEDPKEIEGSRFVKECIEEYTSKLEGCIGRGRS